MLNEDNLDYDDYSTTKLEFERFDALKDNNCSRNNNENNSSNTIRALTLH